jgi:hypothetical protein
MNIRSKLLPLFGSFVITALLAAAALADTIHLKDGSIIKGRIVNFSSGRFVVEIGEGSRKRQLTFTAAEVESIKFDDRISAPQMVQSQNRTASYTEPAPKTDQPVIVTARETAKPAEPRPAPVKPPTEKLKPIEWRVKVTADNTANGWTNTGWVVKKGQHIRITGDGTVSLGNGKSSPPSGVSEIEDRMKLLKNVPTGALIAVIGDDNNDFIYVGAEREITATRDGALFLGINEGNLDDNSGTYNVKIEIVPEGAE